MPIANCYIKKEQAETVDFQKMVNEWTEMLDVDKKDITLNVITGFKQFGQNFKIMTNLYLPSIWSQSDIEKIQKTLLELLAKYLNTEPKEIFIMTSIIESGHVLNNGKVETWKKASR